MNNNGDNDSWLLRNLALLALIVILAFICIIAVLALLGPTEGRVFSQIQGEVFLGATVYFY
jgi:uncharacterized membrane protein YdfJ with MMPL/SSD domain